jgi:hypothetical protein
MSNPQTTLIDGIYMWVAVDPKTGVEGVPSAMINGIWTPLIAADEERLQSIRHHAEMIKAGRGQSLRLIRLDARHVVEELS